MESIGRTKRNPVASRDEDFYASLAAEADQKDEEVIQKSTYFFKNVNISQEVAVTEEDAQKIASNMAVR